ncbi:hypothetical protein JQ628_03280 [Bradyrhizobium lablabi]|uniref:hypothetical protein n=1 Tax=Bradyrhizobium lablabi TaxID=722472 RepID=UPI001BA52297|nr:hypothetical protein [Bradyrhizobium lablabi]MBR1120526.1 hypothetical protein [Bradyrhizobium lablabi]
MSEVSAAIKSMVEGLFRPFEKRDRDEVTFFGKFVNSAVNRAVPDRRRGAFRIAMQHAK